MFAARPVAAYEPVREPAQVRPYDANLPNGVNVKIPQAGLDALAGQLEAGLQGNSLRTTIVQALEGQYFEVVLPIFGGNLRLTIPCGTENTHRGDLVYDATYLNYRPWCPYVRGESTIAGQASLPITTTSNDGFRYERVALAASTYPIGNLALPEPNSLFAALYLLENGDKHAELDMIPEHPLFKVMVPVPVPTTDLAHYPSGVSFPTVCFNLLGNGQGCTSTFVATLEADLVTGGQLKPYFESNTLFVLVNDFHTKLTNLRILTPITQNSALIAALDACIATPGIGAGCVTQKEQTLLLYSTIEQALGDAALQFFENELNVALSGVLEDGINQLLFDREKDGTPDPVINLDKLAEGLTDLSHKPFKFNFNARYEASSTDPAEAFFIMDGGLYAGGFSTCVNPGASPAFRYTDLELDGNTGQDPPHMGSVIPGTNKPYQIGLAVSDDLINQLIYNVWASGLLCVSVDPRDPAIPKELSDLLTTDSFAPFLKWLPKLAPHAPVMIQINPQEAPYVTFGGSDQSLFQIHLQQVGLDVYVEVGSGADKRFMRAFGLAADITAAIDINAINFDKSPLIDLDIQFESATTNVLFDDLHPEHDAKVVALVAPVLDALAPSAASLVGDIKIPFFTDCIGGVHQEDLVLATSGHDPKSGFDNYLNIYMNFSGLIDFNKIIGECLLVLSSPREMVALQDLGNIKQNPVPLDLAVLGVDSAQDYRWRIDGGFWSPLQRGAFAARPLLDGKHRVEFQQHGTTTGARFFVDSVAPMVNVTETDAGLRVETIDLSPVYTRINGGNWSGDTVRDIRLAPGRHTLLIETRDAVGNEASFSKTVTVRQTSAGCASTHDGTSAASWWLVLIPLFFLKTRRSY